MAQHGGGGLGIVLVCALAAACHESPHAHAIDAMTPGDVAAADASSAKDITAFVFRAADNPVLAADVTATISGTAIVVNVPFVDVRGLRPTFTLSAASVTVNGTAQVSGQSAQDFSSAVTYRAIAVDGSTKDYEVTVVRQTFWPSIDVAIGSTQSGLGVADLNGDGKPDVILLVSGGGVAMLLDATATAATTPVFSRTDLAVPDAFPQGIAVADLNGDARPDIVVVGSQVTVFLNTTTAGATAPTFAAAAQFSAAGAGEKFVTVADLNGDGKPDLAVLRLAGVSVLLNTTASTSLTASFAAHVDFQLAQSGDTQLGSIAVADINRDGAPDLVIANANTDHTIAVLLSTTTAGAATPSFASAVTFAAGMFPVFVAAADLDGDGKADVAVANEAETEVLVNATPQGATTPSLTTAAALYGAAVPIAVAAVDLNGDGKPDLAVPNLTAGNVSVFLNAGASGFVPPLNVGTNNVIGAEPEPFRLAAADLNGDGKLDLVVANNGALNLSVLLAQ